MILINSSPKDALKIFQPFLPIYVPVGIGYLLGVVEKEGIEAKFIDEQVEKNIFELVNVYTKKMAKPYIFGFSVVTAAFERAVYVSRRLKEIYPDAIICFGGVHPTAIPNETLSFNHIDVVVRGESEKILPELYRCIKAGKAYNHLNNISYRDNGRVIHNDMSPVIEDLDNLPPFPYDRFLSEKYDMGFVVSSRGCPYNCIFCSNRITTGKKYRFRSPEAVVDDIDLLYHKYGKRFITFHDDNFLVNKDRIYQLLGEIRKKDFSDSITFDFQARGDNVDYKLLKEMFDTGFKSVFFGIETASEKMMQVIKKGETVEQCVKAVRMAKEIGYRVNATFIFALPGERHKDRMECIKLSKELKLDLVRYNNATPYPGTELYQIAKKDGGLNVVGLYENFNSVSTFIESPFKKIAFSYVPKGNTEKEIRRDILLGYLAFYLNRKKIQKIFAHPEEGAGWFNAGERFVELLKMTPALALLGLLLTVKFVGLIFSILTRKYNGTLSEIRGLFYDAE